MSEMNYMRQRGRTYCVHCEYETLDSMSFDEQNAAMRDHMVTAHPNWLTPEQLRVHDLLPEEERRTQERIAAVVRERDERIAALEAQLTAITAERDALLCSGAAANSAHSCARSRNDVIAERRGEMPANCDALYRIAVGMQTTTVSH